MNEPADAALASFACARHENSIAAAFRLDVVNVALRSLHPKTQHCALPPQAVTRSPTLAAYRGGVPAVLILARSIPAIPVIHRL